MLMRVWASEFEFPKQNVKALRRSLWMCEEWNCETSKVWTTSQTTRPVVFKSDTRLKLLCSRAPKKTLRSIKDTKPPFTNKLTHSRGTAPRHRRRRPPSGRSCRTCRLCLRSRKARTLGLVAQRTSEATACWVVTSCCLRRCDLLPPCPNPDGRQNREKTPRLLFPPVRQKGGGKNKRED